ncbi:MAG: anti-sigma factor family protein [Opitutales bacterium]|jgi:ferric-dicitrate binding protein FerR (iron transport regulator)
MNEETAISLSAGVDGEASPGEVRRIEALLENDPEARAYVDRLIRAREAMGGAHVSSIDGDAALESFRQRLAEEAARPAKVLHFPRYATAAAAILALGMGLWIPMRKMGDTTGTVGLESSVYMVETELENAIPVVYIDEPSGWTVVWVLEEEVPEEGQG